MTVFLYSLCLGHPSKARYAVGRCLMLWSSNDVTQQGSRPKTKLCRTHPYGVLMLKVISSLLVYMTAFRHGCRKSVSPFRGAEW